MDKAPRKILVLAAKAWLHVTATLIIAVVLGLLVADWNSFEILFAASTQGRFEPDWSGLALHLVLSASVWASTVGLYWLLTRRSNKPVKVYKARGAVTLETLIALIPFLLLTSGIAQMAMVNVASILSDLAVYQAARTAWLWQPEAEAGRNGVNQDDVEFRARTAAALTLAPSAPSDYHIGRNFPRGSGPPFRRIRTAIAASFNRFPVSGETYWSMTGNNWSFFGHRSIQATGEDLTFWRAFDSHSFAQRAGRKCTSAWMSLEDFEIIDDGNNIGARFTYRYPLVFPWFAYIYGDVGQVAGRGAFYMPIKRQMTLEKQPTL